ncbi:glycosyltransferase, partial [Candidatus Uhrbacteria bacterium]|nr:glycosyltransferase [Candidatus Uhrbacteria bacterium]
MRVAILANTFPPDGRGGAEQITWLQVEELAAQGHDVRVWAPRSEQTGDVSTMRSDHIHVKRFPSKFSRLAQMHPLARLWFHLVTDLVPIMDLVEEILAWKPNVLISHNLTGCGIGTPSMVQRKGIPWMHILHDIQLTEPSGQLYATDVRHPLKRLWRAFWARYRKAIFFGKPTILISPTSWLLAWHQGYGFRGLDHRVLPNPMELHPTSDRIRSYPGTLLFVGRLSEDKGFDDLLELVPLVESGEIRTIRIIGDGPMRPQVLKIRDRRIVCDGVRTPSEVRQAIRESELLVAPSKLLENQQTILLEAMAEGTPVIATDVGGTQETLQATGCPLIAPHEDVP